MLSDAECGRERVHAAAPSAQQRLHGPAAHIPIAERLGLVVPAKGRPRRGWDPAQGYSARPRHVVHYRRGDGAAERRPAHGPDAGISSALAVVGPVVAAVRLKELCVRWRAGAAVDRDAAAEHLQVVVELEEHRRHARTRAQESLLAGE